MSAKNDIPHDAWCIVAALVNCAMVDPSEATVHQVDRLSRWFGLDDKRGQQLRAKVLRAQSSDGRHVIAGPRLAWQGQDVPDSKAP